MPGFAFFLVLPLSLSIFGQLFRTAFAVGEEAEEEEEEQAWGE